MGMSVSIATAIIFIASLISFASIVGTLDEVQDTVLEAQRMSSEREVALLHTSIMIESIDRQNGSLEVSNSGEVTLTTSELDILINGTLSNERITSMTIEGNNSTKLWLPGEVLVISISGSLDGAAIKLVVANGASIYDQGR
jgi:archaeal flagellar protein FlaF